MNELESPVQLRPDTELVAEIQKEYTLKRSLKKKPGQILYAVYFPDFLVKPVKIKSELLIDFKTGQKTAKNTAHYDENAIYVWALNAGNAIRKVKKSYENFRNKIKNLQNDMG
jgi:hypothetical protein